jgi:hypothetical protein
MDFKQIFAMSFDAIKERKIKSILTILMVMVGSSLMVAVSGIGSGFSEFFNKQTSNPEMEPGLVVEEELVVGVAAVALRPLQKLL